MSDTNPPGALPIVHDAARHRFDLDLDGANAHLLYRLAGKVMQITHTEVPPQLGGRGIAGQLVEAAIAQARAAGWQVTPLCSYARAWMQKHPGSLDLVPGGTLGPN